MSLELQPYLPIENVIKWNHHDLKLALVSQAILLLGSSSNHYDKNNPDKGLDPACGFDCTGFIHYLFHQTGFPLSSNLRHANQFFDLFGVNVDFKTDAEAI